MIDAADVPRAPPGIAPEIVAIGAKGGNFKHGPAWLGPLLMAVQPPGGPAAAAADSWQEFAKHLYNHKNISPLNVVTHMVQWQSYRR